MIRPMSRSRHFSELRRRFGQVGEDGARRPTFAFKLWSQERFELLPPERSQRSRRLETITPAAALRFSAPPVVPGVIFPASVAEMRTVLGRLPPGSLNGLARIRLCDPRRDIRNCVDFAVACRTDVLGTLVPPVLGRYRSWNSEILLYGYFTTRPARLAKDEFVRLRREFFDTLLHEVAHHVDARDRKRGARTVVAGNGRSEAFAVAAAQQWLDDAVGQELINSVADVGRIYEITEFPRETLARILVRAARIAADREG
jgi:hypothetical protein